MMKSATCLKCHQTLQKLGDTCRCGARIEKSGLLMFSGYQARVLEVESDGTNIRARFDPRYEEIAGGLMAGWNFLPDPPSVEKSLARLRDAKRIHAAANLHAKTATEAYSKATAELDRAARAVTTAEEDLIAIV